MKLIVHCPTEEDYLKIQEKFEWSYGEARDYIWDRLKEETAIVVINNEIVNWSDIDSCKIVKEKYYSDYTFTTAQKLLKEDRPFTATAYHSDDLSSISTKALIEELEKRGRIINAKIIK